MLKKRQSTAPTATALYPIQAGEGTTRAQPPLPPPPPPPPPPQSQYQQEEQQDSQNFSALLSDLTPVYCIPDEGDYGGRAAAATVVDAIATAPPILRRTSSSSSLSRGTMEYNVTSYAKIGMQAPDEEDLRKRIFQLTKDIHVRPVTDPFAGEELRFGVVKTYVGRDGLEKELKISLPFSSVVFLVVSSMTILKLKNPHHLTDLLSMKEFIEVFNVTQLQNLVLACLNALGNENRAALRELFSSEEMERLTKMTGAKKSKK